MLENWFIEKKKKISLWLLLKSKIVYYFNINWFIVSLYKNYVFVIFGLFKSI